METRLQVAQTAAFSAQLHVQYIYYIVRSNRQLYADNIKQLFCTIVCSLMMDQEGPKHVGAGVL